MLDQIKSTKSTVKAVLLVGGFGQSAYLRDRIREAVGNIEVMQSPNGYNIYIIQSTPQRSNSNIFSWTAVVRGALMKGLACTTPTFATVKISGRSARKHYGIASHKQYDPAKHEISRR